ncbi:hypothetical protein HRF87_01920 [Bacillus sp. CRN 9]|nr:hypothetical protein [Bacillus sp. CRN 9]
MAELIEIKKGDKILKVTKKVFEVVYADQGYQKVSTDEGRTNENDKTDDINLLGLSKSELANVNKDVIKTFLDREGFEYDSNAKKEELIALIAGDSDGE